jgi:rhodanese-related sulfurtransferase
MHLYALKINFINTFKGLDPNAATDLTLKKGLFSRNCIFSNICKVVAMYKFSICLISILAFMTWSFPATAELVDSTPESVAGATTVDAAQAKTLFDQEALFVDLRKENMWNSGRIPGAVWLEMKSAFTQEALESEAAKDEALVFYCSGVRCPRSAKACEKALSWGFTNVNYFRGGFPAWKNAGLPIE